MKLRPAYLFSIRTWPSLRLGSSTVSYLSFEESPTSWILTAFVVMGRADEKDRNRWAEKRVRLNSCILLSG